MSATSLDTARCPSDARGASVPSSGAEQGYRGSSFTVDERLRLLGQLRAALFSANEHPDVYTRGWNAGMQQAIELLFPLPVPVYSCSFPTDDVSRGLRELAR